MKDFGGKNITFGILGCGTMGGILFRVIRKAFPDNRVLLYDKNSKKGFILSKKSKLACVSENIHELIKKSTILILAVKPQDFLKIEKVVAEKNKLIVSIMAGVSIKSIARKFKTKKIIRAMPNMASGFSSGVTGWTSTKYVSEKEKDIIKDVFNLMGASYYFASENKINDVTAVSGSGPAYFLYTIICFIKSAIKLGFSKKEALNLVKDTFKGSYVLANKVGFSVKNLENLIKQVTSKGGTTEVALKFFKKKKFEKIWEQSVMSAFKRAVELSKKYN